MPLEPFQAVASGKVMVLEAKVEVALLRFTLRFQPFAEFVATVALDVAEIAAPGVSEPKLIVLVDKESVIVWFTVRLMVWDVLVETWAKTLFTKIGMLALPTRKTVKIAKMEMPTNVSAETLLNNLFICYRLYQIF